MPKDDQLRKTRELAWIGDAVLSLYARQWILKETGKMDGAMLTRFTSNHFLASFGNPTEIEAQIGTVYLSDGQEAAETWMRETLIPTFRKQENNRVRGTQGKQKS